MAFFKRICRKLLTQLATSRPQRSQAAQRPSVDPHLERQNVVATFCLLGLYSPASLISAFKLLKLG